MEEIKYEVCVRFSVCKHYSSIAQLVERMTVNHDVVGSSPTWGVDVAIEARKCKQRDNCRARTNSWIDGYIFRLMYQPLREHEISRRLMSGL